MKTVVLNNEDTTIECNLLTGNEIVAYLSDITNMPKVLSRLRPEGQFVGMSYGFISIGYPLNNPTFADHSFHESVRKALQAKRKLFAFDNYQHFRTWAYSQKINK